MVVTQMCLLVILAILCTLVVYLSYAPEFQIQSRLELESSTAYLNVVNSISFNENDLIRNYHLNISNNKDVLVFLHIQKTGGSTFGRHLVKDLNVTHPCVCYRHKKRCNCKNATNRNWIFSRYSTGWTCGLHADWTELNDCVDDSLNRMERRRRQRRYFYVTMLRDPIQRFISEWKNVQRGSTWMLAKLKCSGRQATLNEVPFCFTGNTWSGVTLEAFTSCPHNLAHNRQTRMLANLSVVDCYNRSTMTPERRDQLMLESAKMNLRDMAYFGLTEYQLESQLIFEKTFHVKFIKNFVQHHATLASRTEISPDMRQKIVQLNQLDLELYRYAKQLFIARLKQFSGAFNVSATDAWTT